MTKLCYKIYTDPPEGARLEFIFADTSLNITLTCDADGLPPPTYEILRNGSFFALGKIYTIHNIANSSAGNYNYTCVAENFLGRSHSPTRFLPKSKLKFSTQIFLNFYAILIIYRL